MFNKHKMNINRLMFWGRLKAGYLYWGLSRVVYGAGEV